MLLPPPSCTAWGGWSAAQIAEFSNRLGAVVASRAGAIPAWTLEDCKRLGSTSIESGKK